MKLDELSKVQNPMSGAKGSMFDPIYWVQNVLGVGFLFIVFALGQKLANMVTGSMPLGVNTSGTSLITSPQAKADSNVQPTRAVY